MMFARLISKPQKLRYKYLLGQSISMLENFPLDHLRKHLLENHDPDWMFEHIDFDGLAFNCYLPVDSPETYIIISWDDYTILEVGKQVPQGLIDEIKTAIDDGMQIYLGWESTTAPQEWA